MSLLLSAVLLLAPRASAAWPELRMDERVELVSAVALLAGADSTASGFYEHPIPYARRLRREMAPFASHPAVAALDKRLRAGLTSLDLYQLALRNGAEQLPQPLVDRLGGPEAAAEFPRLLERFSRDADFPGFWRRSAEERAAMLAGAAADMTGARAVLERYAGGPPLPHAVILSPEAEPVFAVTVPDGAGGLLSVFGPERYRRDGLFGRKFRFNLESRRTDLWRQELQARLLAAPGASPEIAREAAAAAVARLLRLEGSAEMADLTLTKYARVGMPRLRALHDRLGEYEAARERYPNIASFYPELARAYEADSSVSDFSGGLDAVWRSTEAVVVIAPERWAAAARPAWPSAELIDPQSALARDLSGRHVIAIGSSGSNAWLAKNWDALKLPLAVASDGISWSRSDRDARAYALRGKLGLITVARHPTDRLRGSLIITAASDDAVPSLEQQDAPGLDFLILDGAKVLKAGLYEKSLLPWRPK